MFIRSTSLTKQPRTKNANLFFCFYFILFIRQEHKYINELNEQLTMAGATRLKYSTNSRP